MEAYEHGIRSTGVWKHGSTEAWKHRITKSETLVHGTTATAFACKISSVRYLGVQYSIYKSYDPFGERAQKSNYVGRCRNTPRSKNQGVLGGGTNSRHTQFSQK
jgi:hypothetical protein